MDSDFITDKINRTFKFKCKKFRVFFLNNFTHIDTLMNIFSIISAFFYFQSIHLQIEFFNTKYLSILNNLSIGANSGM